MANEPTNPAGPPSLPSLSACDGLVDILLKTGFVAMPSRPGLLGAIDRFEISDTIGQGGMGVVLLARDPLTADMVAIKMLRPELAHDLQHVKRFLTEAKHLLKLEHKNILKVLEVSDRSSSPYFVMPYKERGSLAGLIQPGEPLDTATALAVARDIAGALAHAHNEGLIHRDVKPHNVLLDSDGTACLADFGLVRTVFNDSLIEPGHEGRLGTLAYMSPAVANGKAEDTRCDIYSFGAVLYEMLTGQPPYSGQAPEIIANAITVGPPKRIAEHNPNADPGLRTVAEGCMARELRERYASMDDVVADLHRLSGGQAPLGPRGEVKWWSQSRFLQLSVSILLVVAIGLLVWKGMSRSGADGTPRGSSASASGSPEMPLPADQQDSSLDTPVDLATYAQAWPIVFEDPLTDASCLNRAYLSSGIWSGPRPFEVLPGEGLVIRGFYHSAAWWNVAVGRRCALFVEFRTDSATEHGVRVWLNGPGYGVNGSLGYSFWIREDRLHCDVRHNGRGIPHGEVYPSSPLSPDWHRLAFVRDDGRIFVWLDDQLLIRCADQSDPETPSSRFAAIGAGNSFCRPVSTGITFRALAIRAPANDVQRLSSEPLARVFDPPDGINQEPDREVLLDHDFGHAGLDRWRIIAGEEDVSSTPHGLVLGSSHTPFLWCKTGITGDFSAECRLQCAPNQDTAGFNLFLGFGEQLDNPDLSYDACVIRCTSHVGEHDIHWSVKRLQENKRLDWDDANGRGWTRLARQPMFALVSSRPYTIRVEKLGSHVRVFLNGRFLMEADFLHSLAPDEKYFVGVGNIGGEKTVEWLKICRLRSVSP